MSYPCDVISMPLAAGSPALPPAQIESIHSLLSEQEFKAMADLKNALPDGLFFREVSYALMSRFDEDGRAHPYTETISVCRLSEDRDLVIVEDNQAGTRGIQRWFIRDLERGV